MTSVAHVQYPSQRPGALRAEPAARGIRHFARRAAAELVAAAKDWAAARRRAAEDAQFWRAAQSDARIMADISRAMSTAAARDIRGYY